MAAGPPPVGTAAAAPQLAPFSALRLAQVELPTDSPLPTDASRLRDATGYRLRAASLALSGDGTRLLLASSTSRARGWLLPGGGMEPGESPSVAAVRELAEEAGAVAAGGAEAPCCCWLHDHGKSARTALCAVLVERLLEDGYMDAGRRSRAWCTPLEVEERLAESSPSQYALWRAALLAAGVGDLPSEAGGSQAAAWSERVTHWLQGLAQALRRGVAARGGGGAPDSASVPHFAVWSGAMPSAEDTLTLLHGVSFSIGPDGAVLGQPPLPASGASAAVSLAAAAAGGAGACGT